MAPAFRAPIVRYVIAGVAILTILHYFLSYTSPTYSENIPVVFPGRRQKSELAAQELALGNKGEKDDASEDWSKRVAAGKGSFDITSKGKRANAAFVILVRNQEVFDILESIRGMEDRFNRKYHYPYVFLNDVPFTEDFKKFTSGIASGPCTYGLVPASHWSEVPDWIDQDKAKAAREQMSKDNIMYGDSVSYRAMCRYQSGFFWRHPLLDGFEYYWRIEPHVKYFCDLDYDPFLFMSEKKLKYGFTLSLYEYAETIVTLWDTTKEFIKKNPQFLAIPNQMDWLSNDKGETYNHCHFWSNFEIGSLEFYRSDAYRQFFDYLDHAGGFYYERWGDAPVHSIAAALFLRPDEMHFFQDIGYRHEPFQHCPKNKHDVCACDSANDNGSNNFEQHGYSCTAQWKKLVKWVGKTDGINFDTY